jgi:hypothetical protein
MQGFQIKWTFLDRVFTITQVGKNRGQALPCLEVLQMKGDRLRRLNYCFNGDRYQLADSRLHSQNHELIPRQVSSLNPQLSNRCFHRSCNRTFGHSPNDLLGLFNQKLFKPWIFLCLNSNYLLN